MLSLGPLAAGGPGGSARPPSPSRASAGRLRPACPTAGRPWPRLAAPRGGVGGLGGHGRPADSPVRDPNRSTRAELEPHSRLRVAPSPSARTGARPLRRSPRQKRGGAFPGHRRPAPQCSAGLPSTQSRWRPGPEEAVQSRPVTVRRRGKLRVGPAGESSSAGGPPASGPACGGPHRLGRGPKVPEARRRLDSENFT